MENILDIYISRLLIFTIKNIHICIRMKFIN